MYQIIGTRSGTVSQAKKNQSHRITEECGVHKRLESDSGDPKLTVFACDMNNIEYAILYFVNYTSSVESESF